MINYYLPCLTLVFSLSGEEEILSHHSSNTGNDVNTTNSPGIGSQPLHESNLNQSTTIQHNGRYPTISHQESSQHHHHTPISSPSSISFQNATIHTSLTSQPYGSDQSNFGPFSHHHNHIPSYGNPYEKFKIPSSAHTRTATSPYHGTYQGFYGTPHYQLSSRPNGYIDLVPR